MDAQHPQCRRCGRPAPSQMSFAGQLPDGVDSSKEGSKYRAPVRNWLHGAIEFAAVWYHWGGSDSPRSKDHTIQRLSWVFGWRFGQSDPLSVKVCQLEGTLKQEVKPSLMALAAERFGVEVVSREDLWTKEFFDLPGAQEGVGLVFWRNTPGLITGKPVEALPNYFHRRNTYRIQLQGDERVTRRAAYLYYERGSYCLANEEESLVGGEYNPISIVINPSASTATGSHLDG